jgi:hypothetical protein
MRDARTARLRLHCNASCEVGDVRRVHLLFTLGCVSDESFLRSESFGMKSETGWTTIYRFKTISSDS